MRTAIAGVIAWLVLLFGFTLSWSTFVLPPDPEDTWFSNMIGITMWWAIYALPSTFPVALLAIIVAEGIARSTVSHTARLFVRAGAWLPVAVVYCFIIAWNNQELWRQSVGCAFAGAIIAAVAYILVAPDIQLSGH